MVSRLEQLEYLLLIIGKRCWIILSHCRHLIDVRALPVSHGTTLVGSTVDMFLIDYNE